MAQPGTLAESREWTWTTEMERHLLLAAAWGGGDDMEGRYRRLVEDFNRDYGIVITVRELRERYADLRELQVQLLTRWGCPLPPGAPLPPSASSDDQPQTEETTEEQQTHGSGQLEESDVGHEESENDENDENDDNSTNAGRNRTAPEMDEAEGVPDTSPLREESDQSVTYPSESFLSAAGDLAAQESDDRGESTL